MADLLAVGIWFNAVFIRADVLTIPTIRVYQRYYGTRLTKWNRLAIPFNPLYRAVRRRGFQRAGYRNAISELAAYYPRWILLEHHHNHGSHLYTVIYLVLSLG